MRLRAQAIENFKKDHPDAELPKSLSDDPPPRPEPFEEEPMMDVSVDMTANGFDASESFTLDRSLADDMVPVADPGLDRPTPVSPVGLGIHGNANSPGGPASPTPSGGAGGPHLRRKSVLPIDPAVMRDLQVGVSSPAERPKY